MRLARPPRSGTDSLSPDRTSPFRSRRLQRDVQRPRRDGPLGPRFDLPPNAHAPSLMRSKAHGGQQHEQFEFAETVMLIRLHCGRLGHVRTWSRIVPAPCDSPHPQPHGILGPGGRPAPGARLRFTGRFRVTIENNCCMNCELVQELGRPLIIAEIRRLDKPWRHSNSSTSASIANRRS